MPPGARERALNLALRLALPLALSLLPLAQASRLGATPARVADLDAGNQVVPDDTDATVYYSLSPHFLNHWYADYHSDPVYGDGAGTAWAFINVGLGDLVVWWNKSLDAAPLYEAAVQDAAPLGLTATPLAADTLDAWEPKEDRIALPDYKVALGWALPVSDALALALCFRLGEADASRGAGQGAGQLLGTTSTPSTAAYMGTLYPAMQATGYSDTQGSTAILASPQFTWYGERWELDGKADFMWNSIENVHSESVANAAGTAQGALTQTLKDTGRLSWDVKPRLRLLLDEGGSVVLRASYVRLELGTVHHLSGAFTGSGLDAAQLGGYDQDDARSDLTEQCSEAFLGWVKSWDEGRGLLVLGAGADLTETAASLQSWQPLAGASSLNTLTPLLSGGTSATAWNVPFLIGSELELASWLRVRAMVCRNLFNGGSQRQQLGTWGAGGAQTGHQITTSGSDSNDGWQAGAGFGLHYKGASLDTSVNTAFFGAAQDENAYNPLLESTFTYAF